MTTALPTKPSTCRLKCEMDFTPETKFICEFCFCRRSFLTRTYVVKQTGFKFMQKN